MIRPLLAALLVAVAPAAAATGRPPLDPATWGYQLQDVDPAAVAASAFPLMVVDANDADGRPLPLTAVARMKRAPGGGRRTVLAYLSIGEAETYRPYWRPSWETRPPAWLAEENPDWPGNFKVRFWDPDWQAIVAAELDRRVAQGFDGVYLDIVDAYWHFLDSGERPGAAADMVAFVAALASRARARAPGFRIVPQNAEGLLEDDGYRAVIDAIGKEDLYYGLEGDGVANPADEVAWSRSLLDRLAADRKPVLVVEYLAGSPALARDAVARARRDGFVPLIAARPLATLPTPPAR